jgi:hypothetical protein
MEEVIFMQVERELLLLLLLLEGAHQRSHQVL